MLKKLLIALLLFFLLFAVVIFLLVTLSVRFAKPSGLDSNVSNSQSTNNNNKPTSTSDTSLGLGTLPEIKTPTKVIYQDKSQSLHISDLDGENDKVLFKSTNAFDIPVSPSVSPDGKYLTYIALPMAIAKNLAANPPYEMHGSSDYELWLTDLSTLKAVMIQDNFVYGVGSDNAVIWTPDTKGFFFDIPNNDANATLSPYHYDLTTKEKHSVLLRPNTTSNVSPDAKYFVKIHEDYLTNTADSNITLKQYDSQGNFIKNIYSARRYPYASLNYMSSNYLVLDSNIYGDAKTVFKEGDIKCFIDLINVVSNTVYNLETKNCSVPQTYNGFRFPKLSPDSEHLLSLYVDAKRTPNSPYESEIFVYDLATKASKYIAKQSVSYDNYYFVSPTEIIVTASVSSDEKTLYKSYNINISTGVVTENTSLSDKQIISIF